MKIDKNLVAIGLMGVALVIWSAVWVSWHISIAMGLAYIAVCILKVSEEEEQKKNDDDSKRVG